MSRVPFSLLKLAINHCLISEVRTLFYSLHQFVNQTHMPVIPAHPVIHSQCLRDWMQESAISFSSQILKLLFSRYYKFIKSCHCNPHLAIKYFLTYNLYRNGALFSCFPPRPHSKVRLGMRLPIIGLALQPYEKESGKVPLQEYKLFLEAIMVILKNIYSIWSGYRWKLSIGTILFSLSWQLPGS